MLRPFQLHEAKTVSEASELLQQLGEEGKIYSGGTELLLVMKAGFLRYDHLVDVKRIPELRGIRYDSAAEWLVIGATATHREVERSPLVAEHLPIVGEMERLVGNVRVRSQGTVGGNLCFAEPHSDPATLFLVLGAELVASTGSAERVIPIEEFLVDAYTTSLEEHEILTEIRIPRILSPGGAAYKKFGIHERPTLGVAVLLLGDEEGGVAEARIAVGCVGAMPARIPEAEKALNGVSASDFESRLKHAAAQAAAAVDPVDDLHGSSAYKRHLVDVFVRRAAEHARERMGGG